LERAVHPGEVIVDLPDDRTDRLGLVHDRSETAEDGSEFTVDAAKNQCHADQIGGQYDDGEQCADDRDHSSKRHGSSLLTGSGRPQ
jgi:hypothetical protein